MNIATYDIVTVAGDTGIIGNRSGFTVVLKDLNDGVYPIAVDDSFEFIVTWARDGEHILSNDNGLLSIDRATATVTVPLAAGALDSVPMETALKHRLRHVTATEAETLLTGNMKILNL